MKKNAILLTTLCSRLEQATHAEVGMRGLNILLYGWIAKHKLVSRASLCMREKADGQMWLTLPEARSFSLYAGYDLTA